jgi:MFS family permease
MGDAKSWLIFLIGVFAIALFGLVLLVAILSGIVVLVKRLSRKPTEFTSNPTSGKPASDHSSVSHSAYNVVADTVIGLNARKSDNRFQAIFILVSVMISSVTGALAAFLNDEWRVSWIGGAVIGAVAGLVIGLILSGALIMVFRAARHIQGQHQ